MAVELGLNRYVSCPSSNETEYQLRERRNRERTYFVLFVHDRSLSMQTGRHWMLPEVLLCSYTPSIPSFICALFRRMILSDTALLGMWKAAVPLGLKMWSSLLSSSYVGLRLGTNMNPPFLTDQMPRPRRPICSAPRELQVPTTTT
jgi:hypothetical protein